MVQWGSWDHEDQQGQMGHKADQVHEEKKVQQGTEVHRGSEERMGRRDQQEQRVRMGSLGLMAGEEKRVPWVREEKRER
jgi:hypothetical protein